MSDRVAEYHAGLARQHKAGERRDDAARELEAAEREEVRVSARCLRQPTDEHAEELREARARVASTRTATDETQAAYLEAQAAAASAYVYVPPKSSAPRRRRPRALGLS